MSIEAWRWAVKLAPPMPAQLLGTLVGLAEHADDDGRNAYPSTVTLAAYACKAERSVQRDLRKLEELGLIRRGDQSQVARLPADKRPVVYDLAVERKVPGGRAGGEEEARTAAAELAAKRERGREAREAKKKAAADGVDETSAHEDGVTSTSPGGVTPTSGRGVTWTSERGDVDVATGVTPTSERGDAHVTQTSLEPSVEPPLEETLFGADELPAVVLVHSARTAPPAPTFDDFWAVYPKRRDKKAANKAWDAAIKDGVDAALIVRAAAAYGEERRGKDHHFTKLPTTWFSKGCWDDEPDTPAEPGSHLKVVGGWQPYQNPTDPNAYDGDL